MSLFTLDQKVHYRDIAVVHWDNGTQTRVEGDYGQAGSYLNRGSEAALQERKIDPLIKDAASFGVHPVKVDWFQDVQTEVTYKTVGNKQRFQKSKHYKEASK